MADPSPTLVAGAVAGAVALLVFVGVHAAWIVPIWGMLAMLPVAALVGALAVWPFELSARTMPPAPFDGVVVAVILMAALVPTSVYGIVAGPVDQHRITWPALVVPLALAAPTGALIGAFLTGSAASAGALAVATTAFAFTLGHNLPFFPAGSPGGAKAIVLIVVPTVAAAIVFTASRAAFSAAALGASAR